MREALIVWGGWSGHEPQECATIVKDILEEDGFKVYVEHSTEAFADPSVHDLSLVVPIVTMSKIEKEEIKNLTAAVENGVGIAGFHGGAGNIIDYTVNITRPDDPLMEGISDFPYTSEQYYMHVDPSNEVLATTTFTGDHAWWIDGVVMPVVWKRKYGKGRVFYSALGHQAKEFSVPQMKTIFRRGANWAAR